MAHIPMPIRHIHNKFVKEGEVSFICDCGFGIVVTIGAIEKCISCGCLYHADMYVVVHKLDKEFVTDLARCTVGLPVTKEKSNGKV